jgi:hypothetical protein
MVALVVVVFERFVLIFCLLLLLIQELVMFVYLMFELSVVV